MNMYDEVQDQWANDPERHNLMHAVPQPAIPRNASFNKITEEDVVVKKYVSTGVQVVSLIAENLLCHPFVVLRRQCQVHSNATRSHIVPITLVPVICHLHQHQSITTLWKGLGSTLLIRGMHKGVEDLLSKVTPWPKEISWYSSLKQFFQHSLLKCVTIAIITPFYSASLVETVQSDIASEKPGLLDIFREGFMRLITWNTSPKGRMLPIWALVLPTVTLGIARYFLQIVVEGTASRIMHIRYRHKQETTGAMPRNLPSTAAVQEIEFHAALIGTVVSDVVFYPFETILHRLHLQGTRTIVDNLDTGRSVLPILTNYCGPVDCYEACLRNEGVFGLYKGFGALVLQYAAHIAVIHITRFVLTEVTNILHKSPKKVPPSSENSPPVITNVSVPGQTYLLP